MHCKISFFLSIRRTLGIQDISRIESLEQHSFLLTDAQDQYTGSHTKLPSSNGLFRAWLFVIAATSNLTNAYFGSDP